MPPVYFAIFYKISTSYSESDGKIPNTWRLNWFISSEIAAVSAVSDPEKSSQEQNHNIAGGIFLWMPC